MKDPRGDDVYFMGIDAGTTVLKVAIFDPAGRELACSREKTPIIYGPSGSAERDMKVLWELTRVTIRDAINKASVDPGKIIGIGVTGHGDSVYLLDENGEPVRNGIVAVDNRSYQIVREWEEKGILDELYPIIGQKPFVGSILPSLAWLKLNEPNTLKRAKFLVACKDYIKFKLTGRICTDPTDASATLLNYKTGRPDPRIFELTGLAGCEELMPEIVPGWEKCGIVTRNTAEELGLYEGAAVASGVHDIDATALGSGCLDHGEACAILGTWGVNEVISDRPVLDMDKECFTRIYGAPNKWLIVSVNYTRAAGKSLEWFIREFGRDLEECARRENISPYRMCDEEAMNVPPSSDGVLFLPEGILGLRSTFYGISAHHTRAHLLRAIMEGVAYATRLTFEKLNRVVGVKRIVLAGGGSRSPIWPQIIADILGKTIEVPEGMELGAKGAAICGAIASGFYEDHSEALRNMTRISSVHEPNDANKIIYEREYRRFLKLREFFDRYAQEL